MRRILFLFSASVSCLALVVASSPARAATLPFTAVLTIQVGDLPAAAFTGSGVALSNGLGGIFTLPSNIFSGSSVFPISVLPTTVMYISQFKIVVSGNTAGSFNPSFSPPLLHTKVPLFGDTAMMRAAVSLSGGGVGGPMQIGGAAFVNILGFTSVAIPLSNLGVGSTTLATAGAIQIQPVATQWSTGRGKMFGVGPSIYYTPHAYITGSDMRTAGGAGQVTLITPVKVFTANAGVGHLPVFTRLQVTFIPEPGTALLVGAGLVGLAAFHRKRRTQSV